jgi:hypothetical protein
LGPISLTAARGTFLDPQNPADAGKQVEFDSFVLRRRRSNGNDAESFLKD